MSFSVATDWNPKQAQLKELLAEPVRFAEARQLLLAMHSLVHASAVYGVEGPTYLDEVWEGLDEAAFRTMPTARDVTIAWDLWHIARIEDITANILIADGPQVLDSFWLARLKTAVTDTGNAMTDEEILSFSAEVGKQVLYDYRAAVGARTKAILEGLEPGDLKRKFSAAQVRRIMDEGGVTEQAQSVWLLDFWGRKTVAGILQMPITRHQIVHLNDCRNLRKKMRK